MGQELTVSKPAGSVYLRAARVAQMWRWWSGQADQKSGRSPETVTSRRSWRGDHGAVAHQGPGHAMLGRLAGGPPCPALPIAASPGSCRFCWALRHAAPGWSLLTSLRGQQKQNHFPERRGTTPTMTTRSFLSPCMAPPPASQHHEVLSV